MNNTALEIKLEREKRKTLKFQEGLNLTRELMLNPLVLGFGAAQVNHALYKTGWYEADTRINAGGIWGFFGGTISPQEAAANMHDSIFIMIAAATVIGSLKAGASVSSLNPLG